MATIHLDPVTKIEGHLAIEIVESGGSVSSAKSKGTMYRGFENILRGRYVGDAIQITQRI
jgi:Ni,Fe-hydrogenase I large subunit